MSFLSKVEGKYGVVASQYKEKPLPEELQGESGFIKEEIRSKGFAAVGYDLGGDAHDMWAVVPIEKAEDLDRGRFDLPSADSGDDVVYLDKSKDYAWKYLGVVD